MLGRKAAQATVPPAGNEGQGAARTYPQRSVWTDRSNDIWRHQVLCPLYRLFYQDDVHLSTEEEVLSKRAGKIQGIQGRSGNAENWKIDQIDQKAQDRWRRRIRKMDGYSSQGLRDYSRNYSTLQPRPERCRRTGKSHDHGKSQGDYCRIQTRQKALDGTSGNGRIPQKSQSNERSHDNTLRNVAWKQTRCRTSQNYRIDSIHSRSKGKAHQARHPLAEGDHDRLRRRHQPVQGMGSYEERRRHFKGCSVYRGKADRSNSNNLRRRTSNYVRLNHGSAWPTGNRRRTTTTSYAFGNRAPGFGSGRARTRTSRPRDFIARIDDDNRTSRVSSRRFNKRNTKIIGKVEQGDPYFQEIRGRGLQQKGRTDPHGKDCTEHRSQRRGRIGNSSGSHQSSHTREAVGESDTGQSQFANQEPYMGSRSAPSGSPNRDQQIRVQAQKGRTRTNRQVEGQASGQRIQPDLRHRLPRHLCTHRQTRIDQDTSHNHGNSRIGDSSDGRCDGILSRGIGGRNLHGTARGIRTRQQKEDLVCRLRKSLYGLKQAPRVWNQKIQSFLKSISFDKTYSDPCIYINKTTEIIIAMWVDDLIIFGKDMASINDLKAQLNEEYEMKDLRELKYFLGIQVHRDRERKITHINQSGYNQTILKRYGNWNGKL